MTYPIESAASFDASYKVFGLGLVLNLVGVCLATTISPWWLFMSCSGIFLLAAGTMGMIQALKDIVASLDTTCFVPEVRA